MGQAKQRGTREQRVALAVERDREARAQAEREAEQRRQALAHARLYSAMRLRHRPVVQGLATALAVAGLIAGGQDGRIIVRDMR